MLARSAWPNKQWWQIKIYQKSIYTKSATNWFGWLILSRYLLHLSDLKARGSLCESQIEMWKTLISLQPNDQLCISFSNFRCCWMLNIKYKIWYKKWSMEQQFANFAKDDSQPQFAKILSGRTSCKIVVRNGNLLNKLPGMTICNKCSINPVHPDRGHIVPPLSRICV